MKCRCNYEFCYHCGGGYGKCACVNGLHPRLPIFPRQNEPPNMLFGANPFGMNPGLFAPPPLFPPIQQNQPIRPRRRRRNRKNKEDPNYQPPENMEE